MSERPKVNLSSLLNKPKKDTNTNQETSNVIEEKKDTDYVVSMTTLTKEEVENLTPEQFNEVLKIIENTIKEKQEKLNNDSVSNNVENKEIKKEELEWETEEEKEEFDELFTNYKSDFKKEEKSIFKSIKEKRLKIKAKIRMPKTRLSLLIWLIFLTVIVISTLFIFFPEKHSLKIYKTSILNAKKQYFWDKQIVENKKITIKNTENNKIKEEIDIDEFKKEKIKEALDEKYKR